MHILSLFFQLQRISELDVLWDIAGPPPTSTLGPDSAASASEPACLCNTFDGLLQLIFNFTGVIPTGSISINSRSYPIPKNSNPIKNSIFLFLSILIQNNQ